MLAGPSIHPRSPLIRVQVQVHTSGPAMLSSISPSTLAPAVAAVAGTVTAPIWHPNKLGKVQHALTCSFLAASLSGLRGPAERALLGSSSLRRSCMCGNSSG